MDPVTDQRLAQVLVEFAHTLGTDFSIQSILDHLVVRIIDILPVTGAGVMLMGPREELRFIAASNDAIMVIEHLQNELHEGPCLEAYRTGRAVSVTDLTTDSRFPRFAPRAAATDLRAVFTFPLRLDNHRLGALDLYRDDVGPLAEDDLQAAQVLADVVAAYLFNAQARVDASSTVAALSHTALHDHLTGLPNRVLLEELLDRAVARSRRSNSTTAVLFVDVDGFKSVNDTYGHGVGDELLVAASARLLQALRSGDTLARLGGDEFVAVCEDLGASDQGEVVAARMATVMAEPFTLAGHEITVGVSVGVAFSGPGRDIPDVLLRDADFAMYEAKRRGGGHHQVVDHSARTTAEQLTELQQDLPRAHQLGQLSLVYQPIVTANGGHIAAAEALLRWDHPTRGSISPTTVIATAEQLGLIVTLGDWILREACQSVRRWQQDHVGVETVAVNVSPDQVMSPGFTDSVSDALRDHDLTADSLILEITECVFIADPTTAARVMQELHHLGIGLVLDDFGTGYSSLSYLRDLPFDALKIDRGFTERVIADPGTRSIVAAMIRLGHELGMHVVAEGVELDEELFAVTGLGADYIQGFLYSRPVPPHELVQFASTRPHHPAARTPRRRRDSRPQQHSPQRQPGGQLDAGRRATGRSE